MSRRLVLRPFAPPDAPALFAAFERNQRHLSRFSPGAATTIAETEAFIASRAREPRRVTYGIFRGRAPIGSVTIEQSEELGFWISADHGGRGYATEAAAAVARMALTAGAVERVQLRCHADNERSLAVAARLGARVAGREDDVVILTLDAAALRGSAAGASLVEVEDASGRWLLGFGPEGLRETWFALGEALEERYGDALPADVTVVEAAGEPAIEICAAIAGENALAPQDVLRHNATLAVGAICIRDGALILRHVAPLAALSVAWAVRAVSLVAHEAQRLARGLAAATDSRVFSSFAE